MPLWHPCSINRGRLCSFEKKSGKFYTTSFPFIVEDAYSLTYEEQYRKIKRFTVKLCDYKGNLIKEIYNAFKYSTIHEVTYIYCKDSDHKGNSIETSFPIIIEDEKMDK